VAGSSDSELGSGGSEIGSGGFPERQKRERESKSLARKTTPFAADDKARTKARGGWREGKGEEETIAHLGSKRDRSLARTHGVRDSGSCCRRIWC
jgi:hypothetical protein